MTSNDYIKQEKLEKEYENSISHRYNRDYHDPPIMAEHSRTFVEFVTRYVKPGDRVLDLGCASASLWRLFRKQLPSDISLVGVDLSPGMLEQARLQFPNGDFREGSFVSIPCNSGEFDVVIVSSAFHHINDTQLPKSLIEIKRVMDEHGILVGREPLISGRLSDRGGWIAGALMHLRHLIYRLTHTREYPEPDPGPDHHAYVAKEFLNIVSYALTVVHVEFRNPVSLFFARATDQKVVSIAKYLDEFISHREGQEIYYAAQKNYSSSEQVTEAVRNALVENHISDEDIQKFLIQVAAAAKIIEDMLTCSDQHKSQ